jgi:hypothetical protein
MFNFIQEPKPGFSTAQPFPNHVVQTPNQEIADVPIRRLATASGRREKRSFGGSTSSSPH